MNPPRLARLHAAYLGATSIWPLFDMRSFEAITGPKRDDWLVRTVSLIVLSIAGTLWSSDGRSRDTRMLGAVSAATLGSVSLIAPWLARNSRVYLLDAVFEFLFAAAWIERRT
jgi:hypothetical protein